MTETKIYPHSLEAENELLGCILKDGEDIFEIAKGWIKVPEAFYLKRNRQIWRAMLALYQDRELIDTVTLVTKVKDLGYQVLASDIIYLPTEIVSTANAKSYARIIWEKYALRKLSESAQRLYTLSFKGYENLPKALMEHNKLIDEIQDIRPERHDSIEVMVDDAVSSIKEKTNVIPFKLAALDKSAGGMTRKEITVLGGRPGHGKSVLSINIMKSLIEQGFNVMMINREMSNVETHKRLMIMESPYLKAEQFRVGTLSKDDNIEVDRLAEMMKGKYKNLIMYDELRTAGEAIIEVNRYKPDVVIDDYTQLIQPEKQGVKDRRFEIADILYEYKWACKKNNCSALLVSQLNRSIESRPDPIPKLSDYAESGAIEQTAEAAFFVYYAYHLYPSRSDKYQSMIVVAKSRYGKTYRTDVGFGGSRCKFYSSREAAKEDDK